MLLDEIGIYHHGVCERAERVVVYGFADHAWICWVLLFLQLQSFLQKFLKREVDSLQVRRRAAVFETKGRLFVLDDFLQRRQADGLLADDLGGDDAARLEVQHPFEGAVGDMQNALGSGRRGRGQAYGAVQFVGLCDLSK